MKTNSSNSANAVLHFAQQASLAAAALAFQPKSSKATSGSSAADTSTSEENSSNCREQTTNVRHSQQNEEVKKTQLDDFYIGTY